MKHTRTILVIAAVLLALPFWGMLVVGYPLRWAFELLPGSPLINAIITTMSILGFFGLLALAHPVRYLVISLAAIIVALAALGVLIAAHRSQAWRRPAFYLCLAVLAAVIVFPLTHTPYKPAIATQPDTDLRLVNRPAGLLAGAVRSLQAGAEVRTEVYEPLGWADDQRFVYRMRQGAGYDRRGEWQEGIPGPLMVYDLSEETSTTWEGSPEDLYAQPCPGGACVKPYLEPFYAGSGQEFFPGHYPAVLPSPNGRWHALVAWHIYGPEDLVLIGNN